MKHKRAWADIVLWIIFVSGVIAIGYLIGLMAFSDGTSTGVVWEDAGSHIVRMPCEGGWIYKNSVTGHITFVPEAQK